MPATPVPNGFRSITPYLIVPDAAALITFLQTAFDAKLQRQVRRADGAIGHAELLIGDSVVMLGQAPAGREPTVSGLYFYTADCDGYYQRALAAGGTSVMAPADLPYGDRMGGVMDPAKNTWWIATHTEDVSDAELERRMRERS